MTNSKQTEALREALTSVPDWASEAKEQPAPATELREQEPVGEITAEDMGRPFNAIRIGTHFYKEVPPVGTKLYTSPPAQRKPLTDELNQIEKDLSFHGLTLVKTATGYAVLKLGQITAHAKENT